MGTSEEGKAGSATFAALRPLCTRLLELAVAKPDDCASLLESLAEVVANEPLAGLRACMDYVLFPLVLLMDAAVSCRGPVTSRQSSSSKKGQGRLFVGDKVAEGVVVCLEMVLERCPCKSTPQITMLLRKLTAAAVLSPAEASEEFRHGVVKCVRALLQALSPCTSSSCSCKFILPSPFITLNQQPLELYVGFGHHGKDSSSEDAMDEEAALGEDCPLGFLQSHYMAAAVGHLLSLLLQIAKREAAQAGLGSGKLREEAFSTLRTLLLKVGSADALAFFLPGVASGFTKAVRSAMTSNRHSSAQSVTYKTVGAAGSTGALEQGVRGLAELLVLVLADSRNLSCLQGFAFDGGDGGGEDVRVEPQSAEAALETLRGLSLQLQMGRTGEGEKRIAERVVGLKDKGREEFQVMEGGVGDPLLRVERNQEWLQQTAQHVKTLLSENLPLLCAHPAPAVRLTVVETAAVLLFSCGGTLENCITLLLECLLALACDEWQHVASAAHLNLAVIMRLASAEVQCNQACFSSQRNSQWSRCKTRSKLQKGYLIKVLKRLLDRLPQAIFAGNETMAVLHARRLAAALYFVGPQGVCSSLLDSPEAYEHFVRTMTQCLSFQSAFTGSIDLSTLATVPPLSVRILSENKGDGITNQSETQQSPGKPNMLQQQTANQTLHADNGHPPSQETVAAEQLPRMPPWLTHHSSRLYSTIACILRLAGLSAILGSNGGTALKCLVDTLLETLRQAATELGRQQAGTMDLARNHDSGQVQRTSATSACVLSELIYGASGAWTTVFIGGQSVGAQWSEVGRHPAEEATGSMGDEADWVKGLYFSGGYQHEQWQQTNRIEVTACLHECVGEILHDYLAPEIWELPIDATSASYMNVPNRDLQLLHILQDNSMLQQVLVEGVGVFGVALGRSFEDGGYLALVLYALLEKLGSINQSVHDAADIALRAICFHCGYQSVRELVVRNMDYVVDSLCRQLRHIALYPHAPSLLAAILRHTGAAPDLLPLLEEPMRGIVLELEVIARQNHPRYTLPLLRALREIAKAVRLEGGDMLSKASEAVALCQLTLKRDVDVNRFHVDSYQSVRLMQHAAEQGTQNPSSSTGTEEGFQSMEHRPEAGGPDIDEMITEIQDRQRRQCSVTALATSCLHACSPLLASRESHTCLLALDTIEDGVAALSDIEAAFSYLQAQRNMIKEFLKNGEGAPNDSIGSDGSEGTNNLLPAMHRVWPHLVPCLRHSQPSVIERALAVIASVANDCGGQFFARRIEQDALPLFVKLLREGPTQYMVRPSDMSRPKSSQELMILRGQGTDRRETGTSPAAVLKVQQAVLKCITVIAGRKKSAPAMDAAYGPLVAWVVGLACRVQALWQAASDALVALSNIDADLVWVLVADLAYGGHQDIKPPAEEFPGFSQIFPPLLSSKDAMCMQYSGLDGKDSFDTKAAQQLLTKLESSQQ